MTHEEDEEFKRLEERLAKEKNPMNLFHELKIGGVILRLYPTHDGWSWFVTQKELELYQGLIDDEMADKKLSDEPFAHIMIFDGANEQKLKVCVSEESKGAIPVYTKEKV